MSYNEVCFFNNLIGRPAPDFNAQAIMPDNTIAKMVLSSYLKDSYGFVFFYPADFTFVCPTEILAHNNRLNQFNKLNCKIIGISVDNHFCHLAWKNTKIEDGGIGQINFPLVSDLGGDISRSYGVMIEDANLALRGSFLIDSNFNIRHSVLNDLPLGRNVDEAIRMVEALQFHEQHGDVCPAGWNKEKPSMKPTDKGVAEYLTKNADKI